MGRQSSRRFDYEKLGNGLPDPASSTSRGPTLKLLFQTYLGGIPFLVSSTASERKMDIWQAVLSKFETAIDEPQRMKKWVLSKICQNWKNRKSKLKKTYYDPFHTTRERLQHCPNSVDPI
ncbi:hypothetical protein MRB53_023686 [Persea americana]|uniref:Uncharacterized protein n=1 Tax=Persea americana TaxID=3435 RepID=A0ACC2LB35_PERAE|nr:hypothetical protein MRB53_023686 [Persea americana]